MNKRESLEKALKVWQFIECHDLAEKSAPYKNLGLELDLYYCPFCQYVSENTASDFIDDWVGGDKLDCSLCPARDYWTIEDDYGYSRMRIESVEYGGGWTVFANPSSMVKMLQRMKKDGVGNE